MGRVAITRRVYERRFLIPANTTEANAITQAVDMGRTQLVEVEVIIPNGHVGLTGFAVEVASERVLPWSDPTTWLRGNDLVRTFPLDVQVDARVVMRGFNTGNFEHSFYVRFYVDDDQYLRTDRAALVAPV